MVMTRPYFDDNEAPYRRYSGRGHGFPLGHERELPPAPGHDVYLPSRAPHLGGHENRNGDQASDNDSTSRPRSRIPVACGRCRKRKIRCSGDQGGPCTNCKSAGNESCQFLRVSSTEAQMKSESAGYDYDPSAGSRLNCRMIPYGPQSYGMGVDTFQYPRNSLSAFQFPANPVKSYYPTIPQYHDFDDVEYGLQSSSFQLLPPEHLSIPNYTTPSTGRGWTPTPQLPKTSLFLEQSESAYNHGQLPYYGGTSAFPLRPAISPESKSLSLHGLNSSLPAPPLPGNDRLLPIPAANRLSQGSFLRTADSLLPVSQPNYQSYPGLMSANVLNSLKNHSNSTVHESPYLSMSSSSPESLNSSQMAYSSSGQILSSQSQEMYQTNNNESLFTTNESSDSSYGHSSPASKRGSQSSHATNADSSLPSLSGASLVNGHTYVPAPYQSSYPPPPIEVQSAAPTRHASTSIPAA